MATSPPSAPPRCPLTEMFGTSSVYATFTAMTPNMPLLYCVKSERFPLCSTANSATATNRPNTLVEAPALTAEPPPSSTSAA